MQINKQGFAGKYNTNMILLVQEGVIGGIHWGEWGPPLSAVLSFGAATGNQRQGQRTGNPIHVPPVLSAQ